MTNPCVVVCTPTLHRESKGVRLDHLDRAIESVLSQTYFHVQQIVVRDICMNPDVCPLCQQADEMIRAYAAQDSRLQYMVLAKHEDRFGYTGRNLAIQSSDAPLIAYCDDDVWWEKHHLETQVNALRQTQASFTYSGSTVCNHRGRVVLRRSAKKPYFTGIDLNEIVHRRELIERYGYWNLSYDADWESVRVWLDHGERFVPVHTFTSHYSLKPGFVARALFWYTYMKHSFFRTIL